MNRLSWLALLLALWIWAPAWAYQDPVSGLTFTDPPKWARKTNPPGAKVRFYKPGGGGVQATLGYQHVDLGEVDALSREEILSVTRKVAGSVKDYKLLGSRKYSTTGSQVLEGHLMTYLGSRDGQRLQTTQVFLLRAGRLHLFTLISSPDQHGKLREVLEQTLSSIQVE